MTFYVNPAIVKEYALEHDITQKEARQKLRENYEYEVSKVDFRKLTLRAIDGLRQMSPKVSGLELREHDTIIRIQELERKVEKQGYQISSMHDTVVSMAETIQLMDKILKEYRKPWWKKLLNVRPK